MKYGIIYIWRDRKHKKYYIGCHWGTVDDGYVCSSSWMKQAYKKRPNDFKRRVLSFVYTSRQDMFDEEARWQALIKDEELRVRYYNIARHGDKHWSADEHKTFTIKQKLSTAAIKNHADPEWRAKYEAGLKERNNKSSNPETREKRRQSMLGKNVGRPKTTKFYEAMSKRQGSSISDQHKQSIKDAGTFKKLNSTIVSCTHCGAVGNPGNIARYHNDRCKQKVSIT
jgi:hypothetical protein